jgi:nicotinate phosphoribosyltransferase
LRRERWVNDDNAALLTDLYQLTMAASYFAHNRHEIATFDLFVRRLPDHRNFLVAAGLDDALHYLETLKFDGDALAYLESLGMFGAAFLDYLGRLRFTGEVWAIPEGEVVFGEEPLLRITAPLIEAQLVETFLLNCLNFQTMIASKSARIDIACGDARSWVDFSPRRDHAADAALRAARASWLAGSAGTSNVLAGRFWGIPVTGTMAHSYVMSFESEEEAFRAFARDFPTNTTLLIDTYDTLEAARLVVELVHDGVPVQAVRLDSGDLGALAKGVRRIFDEGGCPSVRIFASGDLDEYRIAELVADDAPIDAFGVGTRMGTSSDSPTMGGVYKLAEVDGRPVMKLSQGKRTLPGCKQVWRFERDGMIERDVIALASEPAPDGSRELLAPVMRDGRRLGEGEPLAATRERAARALASLPPSLRSLEDVRTPFAAELSAGMAALVDELS